MKHLILLLFAFSAVFAAPSFSQETHAPKIVCEEPTFQFGSQDSSSDVEHTFVIRNDGDITLEIKQVRPSCGCTVANISEKMIAPGATANISTKLSLRGRQGPQHKTITVESNDPNQPQLMLKLEGEATTEVQVNPLQLFYGRLTPDATVTGSVEVVVAGTNVMQITQISVDSPFLTASIETNSLGKSFRIVVVSRPPLPEGQARGIVTLNTDHPRYSAITIPVTAFVMKPSP
ncbi:MAG TPA: hypothetical protein DCZ95_15230 [Verrucomicrobia bacterium]|nr:MAG: hypothetical protein A2X46_18985 [Lentisphaerae bacterium GWF2_57_35]HBA85438.1 hypothetical protein [Verrucomicrobiota bacterium]